MERNIYSQYILCIQETDRLVKKQAFSLSFPSTSPHPVSHTN